jgi:CheY-like chemotaxis protein
LAEDSLDDELLFRVVMKKVGVENPVSVVRGGADAIAYFQGKGRFADRYRYPFPKILFLDLKMPGVDGFAVLEWLNDHPAIRDGILIIVLCHLGESKQIRQAYDLGANSFLPKPFTEEDWQNLTEHFEGYWIRLDAGSRGMKTLGC